MEDDAPVRALKGELRNLERQQTELSAGLAEASAPPLLIHPSLAEGYRQKVEALQEALNEPATKDEAFDLVRSLIAD